MSGRIAYRSAGQGFDLIRVADVTGGGDMVAGHEFARQDGAPGQTSRAGMDYTPPSRLGAIKAAGRHTARVKFLKRVIILGAVFSVSIIAIIAAFDPFKHLPSGMSISGVGVEGTRITMDQPSISGLQSGGKPYDIKARTGIQDIKTPGVIELLSVNAHVGMSDTTTTHVLADNGVYDNKQDTMKLKGNVKIANTSGYTFGLKSALIDFKRGSFTSEERMRVDLKGGNVNADAMTISDSGHKIAFTGHVESTFESAESATETTADDVTITRQETSAPQETSPPQETRR